jgi:hypothetical protein
MEPVTERWVSAGKGVARAARTGQTAIAMLVAVTCTGCISMGTRIDPQSLARIKIGVSTCAEVERLFGSPREISETPTGGRMLTYVHSKGWLIPPGDLLFPPALRWLWTGGSSMKHELATITCDRAGIVAEVSTAVLDLEGGHGLLDEHRQSLSTTHRDATSPSAPGNHPER